MRWSAVVESTESSGGVPKAAAFCQILDFMDLSFHTPLQQRTVIYFKTPFLYTRPQILFNQKDAPLSPSETELPSTPNLKPQSSITKVTKPHSETGHFYIKSMPICRKFGAVELPVGVLQFPVKVLFHRCW